jgi:hypothetical protein
MFTAYAIIAELSAAHLAAPAACALNKGAGTPQTRHG